MMVAKDDARKMKFDCRGASISGDVGAPAAQVICKRCSSRHSSRRLCDGADLSLGGHWHASKAKVSRVFPGRRRASARCRSMGGDRVRRVHAQRWWPGNGPRASPPCWTAHSVLTHRIATALRFVGIEHLSADELEELRARCEERAKAVAAERRGAARGVAHRSEDDAGG